jgi:hypothetical protein
MPTQLSGDGGDFTVTLYSTSATRTGTLVITDLDLSNHIISGTFSGRLGIS